MDAAETMRVLAGIEYKDWMLIVGRDGDRDYLQWRFIATCVKTGERCTQTSRKWPLSKWMTVSELVGTAFKAAITAEEHECRENFLWGGKRIFNPHVDVRALAEVCDREDVRP